MGRVGGARDRGVRAAMKTRLLWLTAGALTLSAVLSLANHYATPLPVHLLRVVRWTAIFIFALFGLYKRSLTTWIFVAMLAGAALGHDWPQVAVNLRVISMIFLRLIKTIIAPLIFATLVSGIATHSDLKKVGRMGIKAIVYFEVVTTLALVIGLLAINISHAGLGAKIPPVNGEAIQTQKLSAPDTILHIF